MTIFAHHLWKVLTFFLCSVINFNWQRFCGAVLRHMRPSNDNTRDRTGYMYMVYFWGPSRVKNSFKDSNALSYEPHFFFFFFTVFSGWQARSLYSRLKRLTVIQENIVQNFLETGIISNKQPSQLLQFSSRILLRCFMCDVKTVSLLFLAYSKSSCFSSPISSGNEVNWLYLKYSLRRFLRCLSFEGRTGNWLLSTLT